MKDIISWVDFEKLDIRIGTILRAEPFPEAHKPAYKLTIDFGAAIGIKKSSAQITQHYATDDLIGEKIAAVINFPPKQIGPFISDCLVLGTYESDQSVRLINPHSDTPNGARIG
jgi:tRNA-binding protein